jgi:hypothetical protein
VIGAAAMGADTGAAATGVGAAAGTAASVGLLDGVPALELGWDETVAT